jgi:hypothetical protein
MTTPARNLASVNPELVRRATDEMLALVDLRLPERFWPSEPPWRSVLTALVARMAGIVASMRPLAEARHQADALVLLRALYEHLITFLWLAIDPDPRVGDWYRHTLAHRKALHHDALQFGVEDVLTPEQLEKAEEAETLKPLEQRANEADEFWGPRIRGFYVQPAKGPKNVLTLRGLYLVIYRLASRNAHATIESIDPCVRTEGSRTIVDRHPREGSLIWSSLALPVFAMALVVSSERLGWPDEDAVREINDGLIHEDPSPADKHA